MTTTMPLISVTLRLNSHCLGDMQTDGRVMRFRRTEFDDGLWEITGAEWAWMLNEGLRGLRGSSHPAYIDPGTIFPPPGIRLPKNLDQFRREKNKARRAEPGVPDSHICKHESLRSGMHLTFDLAVTSPQPERPDEELDLRVPTIEELRALFTYIGTYIGISPWGKNYQKGRFSVVHIEEKPFLPPEEAAPVKAPETPAEEPPEAPAENPDQA